MERACSKCGVIKSFTEFYKNKTKKHGLDSQCKDCSKQNNKKWYDENGKEYYDKNKSRIRKISGEHYQRNDIYIRKRRIDYYWANIENIKLSRKNIYVRTPAKQMLSRSKRRSKSFGLQHNITEEDIQGELDRSKNKNGEYICPVFGIIMVINGKCNKWNSLSLDRKDTTKGYIKGNIGIISHRANTLKSNGTSDQFKKLIEYMTGD